MSKIGKNGQCYPTKYQHYGYREDKITLKGLRNIAEETGETLSNIVREATKAYLKNQLKSVKTINK